MGGRPRRAVRPHLDSILAKLWRAHVERLLAREQGQSTAVAESKIRRLSSEATTQGLTPIELKIKLKEMDEQTSPGRFASPVARNARRTSKRRTSRKPSRRTSRNPIPAPPSDPTRRTLLGWAQRTYATGTPVVLAEHEWHVGYPYPTTVERTFVPNGTRGVVLDVRTFRNPSGGDEVWITVQVNDARPYTAGNLDKHDQSLLDELWRDLSKRGTDVISKPLYAHDYNWGRIRPLIDNWPATAPMKRAALPAAQRRQSYKMRPNKIPHPLHRGKAGFHEWVERTYEHGTPVYLKLPVRGWYSDNGERTVIERGTIAEVIEMGQGATVTVGGWFQAPVDGHSRPFRASLFAEEAYVSLAPLTDNWGSLVPAERWSFGSVRAPTLPHMRRNRTSKRRTSHRKGRMHG